MQLPLHLHLPLHLIDPRLRIDWPLLLSACAVGITLLGALGVGLQVRRTRRRLLATLERVFEQLDLMRLEAEPPAAAEPARAPAMPARAAVAPEPAPAPPPPAVLRAVQPPAELADYQAAARLAAHGAPLTEIAERCGVVAGEARVLLALQAAARARRPHATAASRPAPARAARGGRTGAP